MLAAKPNCFCQNTPNRRNSETGGRGAAVISIGKALEKTNIVKKCFVLSYISVKVLKTNSLMRRGITMRYTVEDGGRLNNYAVEPRMYEAEPPTASQKRNYIILGALATALIAGVLSVAFVVS